MKKLFAVVLSAVMLLACMPIVSAAPRRNETTTNTEARYYIQRFGSHMDEEGNVASRAETYFTPLIFTGSVTRKTRSVDYSIVYKDGVVSSDDVLSETVDAPDDASVMQSVKEMYSTEGGYILSSNGKVVDWSKFDTDKYEIRWYVFKFEKGTPQAWHVDGVVVEKSTKLPIEIPTPDDPSYVPPEDLPKEDDDEDESLDTFASNFAYIFGYSDTAMAPENDLLRCEVSAMVHRLAKQNDKLDGFVYDESSEAVFPDTTGEWFRSGIEFIQSKNGFNTQPGENVNPYTAVTRGEVFKIVCVGLGLSAKSDLSYRDYADILYNEGYVLGNGSGDLQIDKLITRAEFCTIYNRIIGRENALLETSDGDAVTAETYGFTDLDSDKWYYDIMLRATSAYDENGFVDLSLRKRRNDLDDYE